MNRRIVTYRPAGQGTPRPAGQGTPQRVAIGRELRRRAAVPLPTGTWGRPVGGQFAEGPDRAVRLVRRSGGSILAAEVDPDSAAVAKVDPDSAAVAELEDFAERVDAARSR